MPQFMQDTWDGFTNFLPQLLVAMVILILGTIVAFVLAAIVRFFLRKTTLDDKLGEWITGKPEAADRPYQVESVIATLTFIVLEIFVLIAFFGKLNLQEISNPLDAAMTKVLEFLPRVLVAILILGVAYVVGRLLKALIVRALDTVNFDDKLTRNITSPGEEPVRPVASPTQSIGSVVFWLVLLLSLPLILGVLQLEGLLGPVEQMMQKAFTFIPNLLLAAIVLGLGYLFAKLVRQIVTNLLQAIGTDRLGQKVADQTPLGAVSLSWLLGYVVFVLILIPVVIMALQTLKVDALTEPAVDMLKRVSNAIPNIFAAALLLLIAYFVGRLLADVVTNLLKGFGFDNLAQRAMGLAATSDDESAGAPAAAPSRVAGVVVLVVIMLVATQESLELLGFERLGELVQELLAFLGKVVLGLIIIGVGLYLSNLSAKLVRSTGTTNAEVLATIARVAIIVVAVAMGLQEMGVGEDIVLAAFIAVMAGGALALGLAFGLGGRDAAERRLESMEGKRRSGGGGSKK